MNVQTVILIRGAGGHSIWRGLERDQDGASRILSGGVVLSHNPQSHQVKCTFFQLK